MSLQLTGIAYAYGAHARVLDGADLQVADGECVALMAPSGSGKTTLLAIAGGRLTPSTGSATIVCGRSAGFSRPSDLRRRTAWVLQSVNALERRSVLDNVALALIARGDDRESAEEAARSALARSNLEGLEDRRAATLSGGELQRMGVARCLAGHPRVVLADEPTANLDRPNADHVARVLVAASREGPAVLIATHDPLVAERADRVVTLSGGRIA